jgi:hypothetical protein
MDPSWSTFGQNFNKCRRIWKKFSLSIFIKFDLILSHKLTKSYGLTEFCSYLMVSGIILADVILSVVLILSVLALFLEVTSFWILGA